MVKSIRSILFSLFAALCCTLLFTQSASAQTDADALMIPKNFYCAAVTYDHNSWTNYWEGTFKRDNGNLGKVTTNTYVFAGNYGITNKLDVLFSVPYVTTNASEGTLKGQHGFQDFTLTLKYLAFLTEIGKGIFSVHAIASGTLPMSNYEADFQPVSIGLHSTTASLRALVNYQTGRFFVAGAGQYIYRDDITIDRNSYYTTQLIYSNRVYIPNATNFLASAGYRSLKLNVEAIVAETTDRGGFDIRKNDNPFPGNNVNYTTAGGLAKYSFEGATGLELTLGGNYVVKGRNVGQSTNLYASVYYVFDLSKKLKNKKMKKYISKLILPSILTAALISSCKKEIIDRTSLYPALAPTNIDLNADTWKPVLATKPDTFKVSAPDAVTSAAYAADIKEIKSYQGTLTQAQKAIIAYWSAGAVLRWNEILRDLVAKHNVPPYQNLDGTYPFPSSTNPFAYPQFPFSNPPYAARAYAYVSAAQYDALVAAYHFKKLYNRAAPYNNDASIQVQIPKSALPSYPSEDAVVAGATVEVMKLLFPTEVDYIEQKEAEEMNYRVMAGANVRGELTAGQSLGSQVADVFVARAKTDRAGKAIGTQALWTQLQVQTAARGEQYWISQESPLRPPQLPLFGKVIPFLFDTLTVVALRPGPPNLTNSPAFKAEVAEVLNYSDNPTRDHQAQVEFWADGVGTYTPPGHWNAIAADEFVKQSYSEVRWARNFALLNMAEMDAAIVCWNTKYFYFNQRPTQANPKIKTLTGIPNFPSYTSGHANFSAAAATVLTYLLPDRGTKFTDLASQASLSRLYGAIHYRSDCDAGLITGAKVGQYAVKRAQTDGAGN